MKNRSRLLCKLAYLLSAALASFGNKGLLDHYGCYGVFLFTIHSYSRSYIARVGRIIDTLVMYGDWRNGTYHAFVFAVQHTKKNPQDRFNICRLSSITFLLCTPLISSVAWLYGRCTIYVFMCIVAHLYSNL